MYDAINKGMAMATGDIIGTLNSDDIFASTNVISTIVQSYKEQQVYAVYGDLVFVEPENTASVTSIWRGRTFKRSRFRYGWMPAYPTFYFRRHLLEKYGYYETHYFTACDFEFMLRYLYRCSVSAYYIPQLIVKMRGGGLSNGNLKRRLRVNRRDYLAMKKNKIPLAFLVSFLKPVLKLHQYKWSKHKFFSWLH